MYIQKTGLPMGNNLSPLLAEVFLSHLETQLIFKNDFITHKFLYYKRYVDDIFIIFKGSDVDLQTSFEFFNSLHPNIKFTFEKETNKTLNFLDLSITRIHKSLKINVYRKPTTTDHVIPFSSFHPLSHKMAAFRFFLNRLYSLPLNQIDFNHELNLIHRIAYNNGYPYNSILKLQNKINFSHAIRSFTALTPIVPEPKVHFSLPYIGPASHQFQNILNKYNINISFSSKDNLKSCLVHTKDPINAIDKSGVYKLNCKDCEAFYIGQTGRKFSYRISEHLSFLKPKYSNSKSSFANHLMNENHTCNPDGDIEILHTCSKSTKLNLLEIKEIVRHHNKNPHSSLNEVVNFNKNLLFLN
ncbi:hypothetical protein RI129_001222 [Pyrocoelia pectoralis]|uniref:Reverse transcriptase domain-containing protein n=1 Tax=Pyrocoelia pectoralis TaxID=417401 RepID=A0AAN7VUY8_9COLE